MSPRHVAVIGAGILGSTLALRLAERGLRVSLVEAHEVGAGTSRTSLAWINSNKRIRRKYHDLAVASMIEWAQLAAEFNDPAWYSPCGNLIWADPEDETAVEELDQRVQRLRGRDYPAQFLTRQQLHDLAPQLRPPSTAEVAWFPSEGYLDGQAASRDLAARARSLGARLITGDPVTRLEPGPRHVTLALASGQRLRPDTVICCTGWTTPRFVHDHLGIDLPVIDAHTTKSRAVCLIATVEPARFHRVVHAPDIYLRPTGYQGLVLEASDIDARTDLAISSTQLHHLGQELLRRAQRIFPGLSDASVALTERCIRPMPQDGYPLAGWIAPNVYLLFTHSGITLAPRLATLVAEDVIEPCPELTSYRPNR